MLESEVKKRCRSLFTKLTKGITFNNPVGIGYMGKLISQRKDRFTIEGRKISIGFGRGTSDVIGIRPVVITQDMVGKTIGQFCAFEMKKDNWKFKNTKHEQEQLKFINVIRNLGGCAGFTASESDIEELVNEVF